MISESPNGLGFGQAALALIPQFVMRPAMKDGVPVESTVTVPLRWILDGVGPIAFTPSGARVFTNIPFLKAPSVEQVRAAYPEKARAANLGGTAVIDCRIGEGGSLTRCETLREYPSAHGFGAAAKALAPLFEAPTDTADGGSAVGARAHVSVTFAQNSLDGASVVIGRPKWLLVPQVNDLEAVLPEAAKVAKVYKARVVMQCRVVAEGAVEGCTIRSQDPAGLGFDSAALNLTKFFRLAVWSDEGLPTVGGLVSIPLRFDLDSASASP